MEKPMNAEPNQCVGAAPRQDDHFFDNVFRIPPSSQGGKFCFACGSQATFVKLDGTASLWHSFATSTSSKRVDERVLSSKAAAPQLSNRKLESIGKRYIW